MKQCIKCLTVYDSTDDRYVSMTIRTSRTLNPHAPPLTVAKLPWNRDRDIVRLPLSVLSAFCPRSKAPPPKAVSPFY